MNYHIKYLKYKKKYFELKQKGGSINCTKLTNLKQCRDNIDPVSLEPINPYNTNNYYLTDVGKDGKGNCYKKDVWKKIHPEGWGEKISPSTNVPTKCIFPSDETEALDIINRNWISIEDFDDTYKNNENVILAATYQYAYAFTFASDEIKRNIEIVKKAINANLQVYRYILPEFQNNRDIIMLMVQLDGSFLDFAPEQFKSDYNIVLEAVKENGLAIQFASNKLKNDRNILIEAIKQNGLALEFGNSTFKNDYEIVKTAINGYDMDSPQAIQFASNDLKESDIFKKLILDAILKDNLIFSLVPSRFKNDTKFVLEAVKINGNILKFIKEPLNDDDFIVKTAISSKPEAIKYASIRLRNLLGKK